MAINSRNVKVVVRDRCFFMDFNFVCGDAGSRRNDLPRNTQLMVQILSLCITPFATVLVRAVNLFSL